MELDSIITTLYLTFAHNQYAIAFFFGMCIAIILMLARPSRIATLLLIGFSVLLVGFEYEKHIMEPLMNQTLESLKVAGESGRSGKFLIRLFQKLLPFGFFIIGWGSLFLAIFLSHFRSNKKNNLSEQ